MKSPDFWWSEKSLYALLLRPLAAIYSNIADSRLEGGKRAKIPVLCIGNFVAGGAGKTPTALYCAEILEEAGWKPVFLTRGYGGRVSGPHLVSLADPASLVGDEPRLLAEMATTVVAKNRRSGLDYIEAKLDADILIMDDGFQSSHIRPDYSIVVVDNARGLGNGHVHPAGPLRASFLKQLQKANAIWVMGSTQPDHPSLKTVLKYAKEENKKIFKAQLLTEINPALQAKRVLAYSGIANPNKFFRALEAGGLTLTGEIPFPDHHPFTNSDARQLLKMAEKQTAQLVTTQKDAARLEGQSGTLRDLLNATTVIAAKVERNDKLDLMSELSKLR